MEDKNLKTGLLAKMGLKYRFVIMTDNTLEEKFSIRLSRVNVLGLLMYVIVICFIIVVLLLSYTPLKEYLPGRSSAKVQKELLFLSMKSDSLEASLKQQNLYLNNIGTIIAGKPIDAIEQKERASKIFVSELDFNLSKEDSILRKTVEANETGSLFEKKHKDFEHLVFFKPVAGVLTDTYNEQEKHFGVDVVAKEKTPISSVLDGTVIISHWTNETGYVIGLQHRDNFISLYKHNSLLIKEVGDYVSAGQHIAIIGNSGEFSSGPHLHFELWHNGAPVNPENYISF